MTLTARAERLRRELLELIEEGDVSLDTLEAALREVIEACAQVCDQRSAHYTRREKELKQITDATHGELLSRGIQRNESAGCADAIRREVAQVIREGAT